MTHAPTLALFALGFVAATTVARPSEACSPGEPTGFSIAEENHAADTTPPSIVDIETVDVEHDEGDDECFAEHWNVDIYVFATDDVTATENMGYLVLDPGETAPTKIDVDDYVNGTYSGSRLNLHFDPAETEATVIVHAVDHGGNVGPGTEVPIDLEGADEGGCSVAPEGRGSAGWLLAALTGLMMGTRRRRR